MSNQLLLGSMVAASLVALACIVDLIFKQPFGRFSIVMDVMFLVAAGIVGYLSYDTMQEMK